MTDGSPAHKRIGGGDIPRDLRELEVAELQSTHQRYRVGRNAAETARLALSGGPALLNVASDDAGRELTARRHRELFIN